MTKKARIDEANVIRGIACLAVVLVHITADPVSSLNPGSIHSIVFTLINRASKFTTPTFIFLSGFTLFYSYESRDFNYGGFLRKRFKATLIPYVIWSIIYALCFYYQGIIVLSVDYFIENLLLAKTSYHLYFIATITQFYILFGLFLYLFRRYNPHILLGLSLLGNLLFMKYISMPYSDRFFMTYIFFFSLGCYVAKNWTLVKEMVVRNRLILILAYISMVLCDSYLFYQYYILQKPVDPFLVSLVWVVFCTIAIFLLMFIGIVLLEKEGKLYKIFKTISRSSYYVYLIHPLILYISNQWFLERGLYSVTLRAVLNGVIVYGLSLSLSIGYTKLKTKMKNKDPMIKHRSYT